jgi:hypothetical protein
VDVCALGDGFISKQEWVIPEWVKQTKAKVDVESFRIPVPQAFPLTTPVTKIELITEPAATLELTVKTKSGQPIEGVNVFHNPNLSRFGGIFGMMHYSSEEPFRKMEPLARPPYYGQTDPQGMAIIHNVPGITRHLFLEHPQYQAPIQDGMPDRIIRTTFAPGATNHMTLILEPKGASYIGK